MARTPTKNAAMHFDGDYDNPHEDDCKASNTGGTEGDKRFLLPTMQVLAKSFSRSS